MRAACLVLLLCSCAGPTNADRATWRIVGPEFERYVSGDASLTEDQKQDRFDLIEAWRVRVRAQR